MLIQKPTLSSNRKYKCLFQLVVFGLSNQMVVAFKEENTVAFKHLFLKGYMDRMDDTYAVYTQTDVYDQIFFAINQVGLSLQCIQYICSLSGYLFLLLASLMVSEMELLCQLLETRVSTHLGFLSLPEHCTCGDMTSLKLISMLILH